jgi:hypothetical protein
MTATAQPKPPRKRRKYAQGTCNDCGRNRKVTPVIFWVNGFKQKYCGDCIKMYHNMKVLLKP